MLTSKWLITTILPLDIEINHNKFQIVEIVRFAIITFTKIKHLLTYLLKYKPTTENMAKKQNQNKHLKIDLKV